MSGAKREWDYIESRNPLTSPKVGDVFGEGPFSLTLTRLDNNSCAYLTSDGDITTNYSTPNLLAWLRSGRVRVVKKGEEL